MATKTTTKTARFCVIDGEFVCDETDYTPTDWESDSTVLWYEITTPVSKIKAFARNYKKLEG